MNDTPEYYTVSEGEDLHAWCARWLSGSDWHHMLDGMQCMLLWFNACRYLFRLPHKGTTSQAMAADARKAIVCLTHLVQVLETPPAVPVRLTMTPAFRMTDLPPGLQALLCQRHEPGARWYYRPQEQTAQFQRQHEWAAYEQEHAAELTSGTLVRVVGTGEEEIP